MSNINTIREELWDGLSLYFETLKYTGYVTYEDVDLLLTMTFLEEMISGCLSKHLQDKDYQTIDKVISCLYGRSCLLKFPNIPKYQSMRHRGSAVCYSY